MLVNGRSHLVQYQVREADYPAYEATIGPEQITWEEAEGEVRTVQVKNIMKTTSLFIQKNWSDENGVKNARALRPEQIEVKLEYAAGNATDWKALIKPQKEKRFVLTAKDFCYCPKRMDGSRP